MLASGSTDCQPNHHGLMELFDCLCCHHSFFINSLLVSLLHCACAVMTSLLRSSASRSIYTSFQLILHLISEMLVSVVVSLADQLKCMLKNKVLVNFLWLFKLVCLTVFLLNTSEMKELGHPSQQLCR